MSRLHHTSHSILSCRIEIQGVSKQQPRLAFTHVPGSQKVADMHCCGWACSYQGTPCALDHSHAPKQYSSSTEIRRVPGHRLENLENHTAKLSAHPTCQFDLGQLLLFQTLLGKRLWGCTSHLLFSVGNMDKVMLLWERIKFTFTDAK